MSSQENLLSLVEDIKEKLTSDQYKKLAEEIAKIDSEKTWKFMFLYTDTTITKNTNCCPGCPVKSVIETCIREKTLMVKESDIPNMECFEHFQPRFFNYHTINLDTLSELLPDWQFELIQSLSKKTLTRDVSSLNKNIKLKITSDDEEEDDDEEDSDDSDDENHWHDAE